jgi:hypothetical protein
MRSTTIRNHLRSNVIGYGRFEIVDTAVGAAEIATDSVGGAELATGAVTSGELGAVHEHESLGLVEDPVAHDGIWTVGTDAVSCLAGEVMLGVTMNWTDAGIDVDHGERAFSGVPEIDRSGNTDTATVQAVFDGGGGVGRSGHLLSVATCLAD